MNEGTLNLNLSFVPTTGAQANFRPRAIQPKFNIAGTDYVQKTFTIGTTDTLLDLDSVSTPAFVLFFNTDANNVVTIGTDGVHYQVRLRNGGGGYALFELNGSAIHAISTPGNSQIEGLILPL